MQNLEGVVDSLDQGLIELIHQAIDEGLFDANGELVIEELIKFQFSESEFELSYA